MKELEGYTKHVLKWRKRAVKAEREADQLRRHNIALRRYIDENITTS